METPPWAPSSAAVAPHLRQYVRDTTGLLEDFTDDTTITSGDVALAITSVTLDIVAAIGEVPEELEEFATSVAGLGAAAEAVLDLNPDLAAQLQQLYESRLARLESAVADLRDGTPDGKRSLPATGCFPDAFGVDRSRF